MKFDEMKNKPIIVLFRQDLRLEDNSALWHASKQNSPLILLYIFDDKTPGKWKIGGAQRWWLHHSLLKLKTEIEKKGGSLILRRGNAFDVLSDVASTTKPQSIYFNRCYEPYWIDFEKKVRNHFASQRIEVQSYNSSLLIEPWELLSKQGTHFKVYTHFFNAAVKDLQIPKTFPKPNFESYNSIRSEKIEDWNLLPQHPNWAKEFSTMWCPGESGAHQKLKNFLRENLFKYDDRRNIPSTKGTSELSPHLHFGEIGPRQIYHEMNKEGKGAEVFFKELMWREFSYYLLYHFPQLPEKPFQSKFSKFEWSGKQSELEAWQKGVVGYPIVDAGMRQLWRTGWMHNRVRMIVASFLVKDLFISWQKGEEWFWDTLVDADLANNAASWQWVAGCGADAAPYFRIFNPILQGEKFDPEGNYIRQWVPELSKMPSKYIHKPWEASEEILNMAGVQLGKNYPYPIVEHAVARKKALEYFHKL